MKKIITFALSAVLALSAAIPVTAEAGIPEKTPLTAQTLLHAAPPVPAQLTAGTAVLEYQEGYEYRVDDRPWQSESIFHDLTPNTEYRFRQRQAGRPETESEPLVLCTGDRSPCSLTPAAPILDYLDANMVVLFPLEGYEYRMNDGNWQQDPTFTNLMPNTEYVFYQRIRETPEECASEATELRVKTASTDGPTTSRNYDQLVAYLQANGYKNEAGRTEIAYSVQIDATNVYYFVMTDYTSHLLCNVFSVSEDATYIAFDTTFELHRSNISMEPTCYLLLCYEGEWYETVDVEGPWIHKKNYQDFCFQNVQGSSESMSNDTVKQMFNNTMAMLCGFWDELIYQELGFGLKGLGFFSYEGYGELYCDPHTNIHVGEQLALLDREPGCTISGREGSQYCTACDSLLNFGNYVAPTGEHQYDHACDRSCNLCGENRYTQHRYSFACDTKCDVCDALRSDPLAEHTSDGTLPCSKCGETVRLLGDVSGDGKVNMGDVAKVYAHTKSSALLTDAQSIAAADTNGDGKINVGDTSRILAHVTGKKLLW